MSHREYPNSVKTVASTNSKLYSNTQAIANKLIRDSEFEFYEHDIFEVQNVFLKDLDQFLSICNTNTLLPMFLDGNNSPLALNIMELS